MITLSNKTSEFLECPWKIPHENVSKIVFYFICWLYFTVLATAEIAKCKHTCWDKSHPTNIFFLKGSFLRALQIYFIAFKIKVKKEWMKKPFFLCLFRRGKIYFSGYNNPACIQMFYFDKFIPYGNNTHKVIKITE